MTVLRAFGVLLRLMLSVLLSFVLVQFAFSLPDPFYADLTWLLLVVVLMVVGPTRRFISRWISTGRLRPPAAEPAGDAGPA